MTKLDKKFIALKLAEECGELASICIQYFVFGRKSESKVIGELGDVLAWISVLRLKLDNDLVDQAMLNKLKVIKGIESGIIPVDYQPGITED